MEDHPPAVVLVPTSADSAALVDPGTPDGRRSLARSGGLVAPALTLVNVIGYLLAVAASRALDADGYGELNALLGVLLVASVPALALQAVVARSVARRPARETPGPRERALLFRACATGAVVSGLAALTAPVVAAFLHVGVAGPLWVAAGLLPLAVLSAAMGLLQGAERFGALALVICAQAAGKAVGLMPLAVDGDPATVLAALALGTAVAAGLALALVSRGSSPGPRSPLQLPGVREGAAAASGLFALLALANLDLLLARNVLPGDESGRYSVGAVCAKAAFWLPQAVAVVVFPRLSEPDAGRAVLRRAVLVVVGLTLLEVAGAVLLARPVLELTFGESYGSLAPLAPLFVLQGGALSVVQLLVYRAIATRDPLPGRVLLLALPVEAAVILTVDPRSPGPVIAVATAVAVLLTVALVVRSRRT